MTQNEVGTGLPEDAARELRGSFPVSPQAGAPRERSRSQSRRALGARLSGAREAPGAGDRPEGGGTARRSPGSGLPGRGAQGPARAPRGGDRPLRVPVTRAPGSPTPRLPLRSERKGPGEAGSAPPPSLIGGCCCPSRIYF